MPIQLSVKRHSIIVCLLAIATIGAFVLYTNMTILHRYSEPLYTSINAPTTSVAIVFGAGMDPDGSQTMMQQDRVAAAVNLYLNNRVERIILSGDDGTNRFDEVSAMYDQAIAYGVPETALMLDPHGYRTYESCVRAAMVFELSSAIVVSHTFHLPRIRYLCESFGIDTIAVVADARTYTDTWISAGPREVLARLKAWWQAEVTHPLPRVTY